MPGEDIDFARSRAILVGTSTYSGGFEPAEMPAATESLAAMREALVELCGWPESRITTFEDRGRLHLLEEQIAPLIHKAEDVLLFYYVGHGQPVPENDLGLALVDTSTELKDREYTSLCLSDLRKRMRLYSPARRKILILDCCVSGIAEQPDIGAKAVRHGGDGTFVLTACARSQNAYFNREKGGLTYYTRFFLEALRAAAEDHTRPGRTLFELRKEVAQRFRRADLPDVPELPSPGYHVQGDVGDFTFVRSRSHVSATIPETDIVGLLRAYPWQAADVFELYPQVVPGLLDPDCRDVLDVFRLMANQERQPSRIPQLLVFAEWEAARTRHEGASRLLRDWVDRVGSHLGFTPLVIGEVRAEATRRARAAAQSSHLVVQLRPDLGLAERFLTFAHLYRDGSAVAEPQHCPGESLTLDQVRELVHDNLARWTKSAARKALTIEFLVPSRLLNQDFDQWTAALGLRRERPLGAEFKVAIRDLDRLGQELTFAEWEDRWTRLAEPGGGYLAADGLDPDATDRELRCSGDYVCLAFALVPDHAAQATHHAWASAVDAGVPVGIWSRGTDEEVVAEEMRTLLRGRMADLPARVHASRTRALGNADHPGSGITFIWDDPTRRPDPIPLKAPR